MCVLCPRCLDAYFALVALNVCFALVALNVYYIEGFLLDVCNCAISCIFTVVTNSV